MAEYGANAIQLVNPGESIVFTTTVVPCYLGLVRHRDGTGEFLLSGRGGRLRNNYFSCPCMRGNDSVNYLVDFGANISIPEGGTAGEISVAFAIGSVTIPE
jgi:hypothetical protein